MSETPAASHTAETGHAPSGKFWALTLGSIGVVYGDIGTSPIYAYREAVLAGSGHGGASPAAILGALSLIIWALISVVTIKYVIVLLRADNHGEGGTLSLMALAHDALATRTGKRMGMVVFLMGVAGASLFFGDAIITPAISVLSAVEGLKLVTPAFDNIVIPATLVILIALFAVQSRGTAKVAGYFGPITLVWFAVIGLVGLWHLVQNLSVLEAFNPLLGLEFLAGHGFAGLLTLGAVFLATTGGEALYSDLGHFGRRPIQFAWNVVAFPALLLNYLGQGAMMLNHPETIENPFFELVPEWALVPLVLLATTATVIASQAVITGAFSMARQAIQLGLLPRLAVLHTSEHTLGQIYMPRVNWILLIGVIALVGAFGSSGALAAAYGIAVAGTGALATVLLLVVMLIVWRWRPALALALALPLIAIDLAFLIANLLKVLSGGWVPLLMASTLILVMLTWKRGSKVLADKTRRAEVPLHTLIDSLERNTSMPRAAGTAIFLTGDPGYAPTSLLHNLKHNKVLHEKNIILSIRSADVPRVNEKDRARFETVSPSFSRLQLTYGFMETPDVPKGLALARKLGCAFEIMTTSFFLSRRHVIASASPAMPMWQEQIFIALARNATDASDYFRIPTGRVVEVGTQVAI